MLVRDDRAMSEQLDNAIRTVRSFADAEDEVQFASLDDAFQAIELAAAAFITVSKNDDRR